MARRPQRRFVVVAALALVALAAACAPVTSPPPPPPSASPTPPPPPPPPPPDTSSCADYVETPGGTQYFALVDDADGDEPEAVTFDAATQAEAESEVARIEATEGDVVAVELDQVVEIAVSPSDDPRYGEQWGVDAAGFPAAWATAGDGAPIRVAVLDTGVRATHQDLAPGVLSGTDHVDGTTDGTFDPHGHGTHVAGIAGMRDNAVGGIGGAPAIEIYPVRVLSAQGSGSYAAVINGINDAVSADADVISMSLGGAGYSSSLQSAITNAVNAGVVVVAAAGNDGSCDASYPGAMQGVIAAAATTPESNGTSLASYSQRGPNVDIAAPGSAILSTVSSSNSAYDYKSGTSMATPFVAAAAALLRACGVPASGVESALEGNASPAIVNTQSGALQAGASTANACP